jgi:hypothetical protein
MDIVKLLQVKPDIASTPEKLVTDEQKGFLKQFSCLAIGEIAGRDSMAALLVAAREKKFDALLPTVVYTGTEYGNWRFINKAISYLRKNIKVPVLDLIVLGEPSLWQALNGRFISLIQKKFNFYSPCPGCHLYMHLIRLPLARLTGSKLLIAGERESHNGRVKINQLKEALDLYQEIVAGAGIELYLPVRHIREGQQIEKIVGANWPEGERQLKCALSGNYLDREGYPLSDSKAFRTYLHRFLKPVGKALVEVINKGEESPNYLELIENYLMLLSS